MFLSYFGEVARLGNTEPRQAEQGIDGLECKPMWCVYILRSIKDKRTYCGSTNDIDRRLNEHNSGKVKSTKYRKPFKLIYLEGCRNEIEARTREKYLKTRNGRRLLKKIIDNNGHDEYRNTYGKSIT